MKALKWLFRYRLPYMSYTLSSGQKKRPCFWSHSFRVLVHVLPYMTSSYRSTRNLIIDADVNAQLFPENLRERATVPHVHPISHPTALLEVHALLGDHPVEALGAGYRGAEPDLLVRGLLVEDKGVLAGCDFQDAGL